VVEGKNCSHRKAARYDLVTLLAHPAVLLLHSRVPIYPTCAPEVVDTSAVPGKLWDVHGVAGAGEALRDVAHFDWRSAEPMNKQKTRMSSGKANALVGNMRRHSSTLDLSGSVGRDRPKFARQAP